MFSSRFTTQRPEIWADMNLLNLYEKNCQLLQLERISPCTTRGPAWEQLCRTVPVVPAGGKAEHRNKGRLVGREGTSTLGCRNKVRARAHKQGFIYFLMVFVRPHLE